MDKPFDKKKVAKHLTKDKVVVPREEYLNNWYQMHEMRSFIERIDAKIQYEASQEAERTKTEHEMMMERLLEVKGWKALYEDLQTILNHKPTRMVMRLYYLERLEEQVDAYMTRISMRRVLGEEQDEDEMREMEDDIMRTLEKAWLNAPDPFKDDHADEGFH
ncbi:hypothetical protein [Alicyclobacillus tolerans]|uniref:Uncharacterized protein n=1 Tax=Alicyclobacillus tolerans TaxID=90970 RepID=A0A1M6UFM3_9BACL|nr:hypothetical protein [Alicyclobacillus montanus]SHK67969.1 hypothetical protein SAMN05443507_11969 [Alicyclobacillus montanus]